MRKRSVLVVAGMLGIAAVLWVWGCTAHAQSQKPLTNTDVVQMVKASFDNQTIIKAIQANPTSFDVSPQALLALKNSGVNQAVIQAMLSRTTAEENNAGGESGSTGASTQPAAANMNPNNPTSPHSPGIYWEQTGASSPRMVELEASAYSRGKTSGLFGSAMSMGLSKAKWKVVIEGASASLHILNSTPEFWFYFANAGSAFSSGPSRPEDFTLVKLEKHKSDRELVVGKVGAFGASSGIPTNDTIAVQAKAVAPGIYEVVPSKPLKSGEYAFLPAGENMQLAATGGKLFDFEVDAPR